MAMIHKFREADLTETFPELNASPYILVMTDEAHRSQYAMLGANLDKGIPNAARIGYTGTLSTKPSGFLATILTNTPCANRLMTA